MVPWGGSGCVCVCGPGLLVFVSPVVRGPLPLVRLLLGRGFRLGDRGGACLEMPQNDIKLESDVMGVLHWYLPLILNEYYNVWIIGSFVV